MTQLIRLLLALIGVAFVAAADAQTTAPASRPATTQLHVTQSPASGLGDVGQRFVWQTDAAAGLSYRVRLNNRRVVAEGVVPADGRVEYTPDRAGWLLMEFLRDVDGKATVVRTAGAVAGAETFRSAVPPPEDFWAFWAAQVAAIERIDPAAVVTPADAGRPGVRYEEISLAGLDGRRVRAQLARPDKNGKFPALVVYQWAGVYTADKSWATGPAAGGWLVLNVSAHDLPLHEPAAFYEQQKNGPLKDYPWIGATSRDTSYFRGMLANDYQALRYLTARPEWDGRTLVLKGTSQGGMQAIAMAALWPDVTAVIAAVAAGCDPIGERADRQPGWPYWFKAGDAATRAAVDQTARYYDTAAFAPRVRCPVLLGVGLRDTTAPPPGIFATANTLGGPVEVMANPLAGHPDPQPKFDARAAAWLKALRTTGRRPPDPE